VALETAGYLFECLPAEVLEEYKKSLTPLRKRVLEARTFADMANRISLFPVDLLLDFGPRHFLLKCERALIVASVTFLDGAYSKRDQDIGLFSLKKWLLENAPQDVHGKLKAHLDPAFAKIDPDARKKLARLRNNVFAHQDAGHAIDPSRLRKDGLPGPDFLHLLQTADDLLQALSLGLGHPGTTYANFGEREMVNALATLAKGYGRLTEPEEEPEVWAETAQRMSGKQREAFNEWRLKAGLDPVDWPLFGDPPEEELP